MPQPPASDLPLVAFDESGNSGQNLLDPKQPLFVLSAVSLVRVVGSVLLTVILAGITKKLFG